MATIRQAVFPSDGATVRRLFDAYVAFLCGRAPAEVVSAILSKYPQEGRAAAVAEFAELHMPPSGALLLVEVDGAAIGCGMMRRLGPGIAELQRIYVGPDGRGRGLGRALTLALIDAARATGAEIVRLDTGGPLVEAIGLYTALGFREVPAYHDAYPDLQPHLKFFELRLSNGAAAALATPSPSPTA